MSVFARRVGARNALYVLAVAAIAWLLQSEAVLLVGCSFVQYGIYLVVFHRRRVDDFERFVRDAVFFKGVSFGLLGACAWPVFTPDPLSLTLMAVGFGLSTWSASLLGRDRTYFAAELGLVEPKWVDRFPYGFIPHPMNVGSMIGLVGVGALPGFHDRWPWLVPAHLGLYGVHLAQEIADGCVRSAPGASTTPP